MHGWNEKWNDQMEGTEKTWIVKDEFGVETPIRADYVTFAPEGIVFFYRGKELVCIFQMSTVRMIREADKMAPGKQPEQKS